MRDTRFGAHPHPVTSAVRWRFRFNVLAVVTTTALLAWGAFVTSINAGMAVPDWPSSFNSYDPFNPWPDWWTITPVLAEHGHRLLGALVGFFTIGLALWTWRQDPRGWMRKLGFVALVTVVLQGLLGGLRVVFASLDLAVVHACLAQVFFALIVGMALFTSATWLRAEGVIADEDTRTRLAGRTKLVVGMVYLQIILGALLRHPGTGIDPLLVGLHITGALVVVGLILNAAGIVWRGVSSRPVRRAANALVGLLALQFLLGLTAYFVTLDESGMLEPTNLQVVVNSAHMVVGAFLMSTAVVLALLVHRRPAAVVPRPAPRVAVEAL